MIKHKEGESLRKILITDTNYLTRLLDGEVMVCISFETKIASENISAKFRSLIFYSYYSFYNKNIFEIPNIESFGRINCCFQFHANQWLKSSVGLRYMEYLALQLIWFIVKTHKDWLNNDAEALIKKVQNLWNDNDFRLRYSDKV